MSLSSLLRPPLVWFTAAEAALIGVLGAVTWHVWLDRVAPAASALGPQVAAAPPAPMPTPFAGQPPPLPPLASASPGPPGRPVGPTPGIRTDSEFLSRQLSELNRVEATFEDLEWRVTRAVADAIERYLESVVLPSIDRSERNQ
jgi:hypothetical protein